MKKRLTTPSNNKYYIRQVTGGLNGAVAGSPTIKGANVLCNCVGYSNGRFNEILNDPDLKGIALPFKYQLVCNAENFIESAKRQGLKISSTPVEGGIMVWQKGSTLGGGDGAGHVAVVEEVYNDGTILTSESGWASWAFKTVRRSNRNGRWDQGAAYKFRGCIINPGVKDPKVVPVPPLVVDGIGGAATVKAMQRFFGIGQDGVISGQNLSLKKYYPALTAVSGGSTGSATIRNLQRWVGTTEDGVLGPATVKAWQKKIGVNADGIFGTNSMKAWQKYLNTHEKAVYPKRTGTKVIDISEFQNTINFAKVKADGIKGVIIRCGYRGAEKGTLNEDARFIEHIKGAYKAGLAVGIYMFTEGITAKEGREEATYAVRLWKKAGVPLSYPIAVDTEAVNIKNERAKNLTKAQRTEVIKAFCERIKELGYEPMIYASTSWLNNKLDMSKLPYKVWVAQYNSVCEYKGSYVMWQYTSTAQVDGISGNVDMNKCYITAKEYGPPKTKTPQDKMLAWAKKIADKTKYHYVRWIEGVAKTHTCPICTGRKYDDAYGGNCIWFGWASWRHGAGLPCKCSCYVFTDYHYNQLLKLSYDDAVKLAKQRIGLDDIYFQRNSAGLSMSQLKPGDVIAYFDGPEYVHTALYIGDGKIADCTSSRSDGIKYGVPSYTCWKIKLAFRYTGK